MATIILLAALACQDAAAHIEKLKSADPDEVENARRDLLAMGAAAVKPLREAVARSESADFKKTAGAIADRLETRAAAAKLASAWGDRWYAIHIKALHVGWANLKVEEKDGKIILADRLMMREGKEKSADITIRIVCQANEYLTPVEMDLNIQSAEHTGAYKGRVKEGRLLVEAGGEMHALRLTPHFTTDVALLRLVTLLPKVASYEVKVLTTMKPKEPADGVIQADKEESIDFDGRRVKCRRFLYTDGAGEDRFYWVDGEGRLLKLQVGENAEIVLSDEKRAKDVDFKD